MEEFIKSLELGKWGTLLIVGWFIWRFIIKDAFEFWLKNSLDYNSKNNIETLKSQRELILKQLEFERVKLERIIPSLEQINDAINTYSTLTGSYFAIVANKGSLSHDFEKKRIAADELILTNISKISIFIRPEFRALLYRIRKVISCSWKNPEATYNIIKECATIKIALNASSEHMNNLENCFYEMCKATIQINSADNDYNLILRKYGFNEFVCPIEINPITDFTWKFLLLHEYYESSEIAEAQELCKEFCHENNK